MYYAGSRTGRQGINGWRAERSTPTFVPLTIDGLGHRDGQLGGVGVEAAHGGVVDGGGTGGREGQLVGVPGHAVQRLRQIRRPLQDDLLRDDTFTSLYNTVSVRESISGLRNENQTSPLQNGKCAWYDFWFI